MEYYNGERLPYIASLRDKSLRDKRRMFIDEFTYAEQQEVLHFFQKHIVVIVSDITRGRGRFSAEWILVINKYDNYRWALMSINEAISIYLGDCKTSVTQNGNIRLGNVLLQRKGRDG